MGPMPKEKLQALAHKAYVLGGWLMLSLCLFSTVGAFVAANEGDYQSELLLVVIAAWSGYEYSKFMARRKQG